MCSLTICFSPTSPALCHVPSTCLGMSSCELRVLRTGNLFYLSACHAAWGGWVGFGPNVMSRPNELLLLLDPPKLLKTICNEVTIISRKKSGTRNLKNWQSRRNASWKSLRSVQLNLGHLEWIWDQYLNEHWKPSRKHWKPLEPHKMLQNQLNNYY